MAEEQKVAPGITAIGFETTEELVAWMDEQRAEVMSRSIDPNQMQVGYGDHAVRFIDSLIIFLYVPTLAEQDEDPSVLDAVDFKQRSENMLWTDAYSTQVVDGELGYTHRSVVWPISERCFLAAKGVNWQVEQMPDWGIFEIEMAYNAIRATVQ
jgi:hypothetical protein